MVDNEEKEEPIVIIKGEEEQRTEVNGKYFHTSHIHTFLIDSNSSSGNIGNFQMPLQIEAKVQRP